MTNQSIRATYEIDGQRHTKVFEGKGTTHKVVRLYLRSLGAKKIKTVIVARIWNVRNADTYPKQKGGEHDPE